MARIGLINPPLQRAGVVTPHLGLAVIANALKLRGHEVIWLDLDLEKNNNGHNVIEHSIAYLKSWLMTYQPDIIGCTAMFNNSLFAEEIIDVCRGTLPNSIIVAGGPHFGVLAERALERNTALDYVVTGEADKAFPDLVEALETGESVALLNNVVLRIKDEKPKAIDSALLRRSDGPLIDLATAETDNMWENIDDIVSLEQYAKTFPDPMASKFIYIEAGRGCPFKCSFCATAPFWQHKYRVKSVKTIVREMEWLYHQYQFDHFILVHDLLTVRRDFMSELCDAIFELRLPITWMANSRVDLNHDGLLPKLRASGCTKLFFGIESASKDVQAFTTKNLDPTRVGPFIGNLTQQGITSTCSFVFGFPDETKEELSQTIDLAARLKLHGAETVQIHRLRLWPPAKIVDAISEAKFDEASLKLEWPFTIVDDERISKIEADKTFFSGYFSLDTHCGDQEQLAQVETFFIAAIATVPMTMALLCRIHGDELVCEFYKLLAAGFSVSLPGNAPESTLLSSHWGRIKSLVLTMADAVKGGGSKYALLINPLLEYEIERLSFVERTQSSSLNENTDGDISQTFAVALAGLDLQHIFEALKTGEDITDYHPKGMTDIVFRRNAGLSVETFIREDDYIA